MKTAIVVGMLTLSATAAWGHNKKAPDSTMIMRSTATAGIGPGASSHKVREIRDPIEDDALNHLTR
jgi:hypothetical protein